MNIKDIIEEVEDTLKSISDKSKVSYKLIKRSNESDRSILDFKFAGAGTRGRIRLPVNNKWGEDDLVQVLLGFCFKKIKRLDLIKEYALDSFKLYEDVMKTHIDPDLDYYNTGAMLADNDVYILETYFKDGNVFTDLGIMQAKYHDSAIARVLYIDKLKSAKFDISKIRQWAKRKVSEWLIGNMELMDRHDVGFPINRYTVELYAGEADGFEKYGYKEDELIEVFYLCVRIPDRDDNGIPHGCHEDNDTEPFYVTGSGSPEDIRKVEKRVKQLTNKIVSDVDAWIFE